MAVELDHGRFCSSTPVPKLERAGSKPPERTAEERLTFAASERCPSGLRSTTGNRVGAERCLEGSNPSLSAGCVQVTARETRRNLEQRARRAARAALLPVRRRLGRLQERSHSAPSDEERRLTPYARYSISPADYPQMDERDSASPARTPRPQASLPRCTSPPRPSASVAAAPTITITSTRSTTTTLTPMTVTGIPTAWSTGRSSAPAMGSRTVVDQPRLCSGWSASSSLRSSSRRDRSRSSPTSCTTSATRSRRCRSGTPSVLRSVPRREARRPLRGARDLRVARFASPRSCRSSYLVHPQHLTHLWALAAAGLVGFAGNEIAGQVRLRGGPAPLQPRADRRRKPRPGRRLRVPQRDRQRAVVGARLSASPIR